MYRKNTAGQYIYFNLVSATDGSAVGGASVSVRRCIDGTWASGGGTVSEDYITSPDVTTGRYKYAMSQADTNGDNIGLFFYATGAITVSFTFLTTAADPTDSVRFGLTALPNAAAGASGGLPLSVDASGRVDVLKINGTSQTARDVGASVLLSSGTGTGQLDFASGVVKSNLAQILGTALTETAGQIAAAFKNLFDVAAPVLTAQSVNQTGDSFARIGAAGAGLTALGDTRVANLDATISSRLASASYTTPPTTAENADAIWDEVLSGHLTAGTTGAALNAAGSVGDPWNTALPGAYGAGTAGKIIGDNIDATVSSRLATAGYTAPDNSTISTINSNVGTAGAGLTALGDTRLANLDAAVSTRSTFAGGAVASVTGNVGGNVVGSVGSVTGLTAANLDAAVSTRLASASYTAPDNAGIASIGTTLGSPAGASVSADIAAVKAVDDAIQVQTDQLAFTVAGQVDSNVLTINGDATSAANLAKTTGAVARGTVGAASTTTNIVTNAFSPAGAVEDQFKGRIVTFDYDTTTAVLRGQATDITASSNSPTPQLTVTALTTAPVSGDTFSVT